MDRLLLFGAPAAMVDGRSLALPVERRSQLVVHLALRGDWVGRAELAALLWPDVAGRLALANLRKTLFRLQGAAWAPALEQEGSALRLQVPSDVADFEAAVREARHRDAAAFAGAALLQGFDDDANEAWSTWLRFERDRLRDPWRASALACLDEAPGSAESLALATRMLEADPLDEAALRSLVDGLARGGHGGRALALYREYAARLQAELGIAPGAELQALARRLQAPDATALAGAVPPPGPVSAPPHGAADADFVGRTADLRRVEAMLCAEGCRLLCILGPGGVGKTRLARETLRRLGPRHAQGGLFVPVEDVADAQELAGRLARELGVAPGGGGAAAAVVEHLRLQQRLLVIDNAEHLANELGLLDRLVQECPGVHLVVTSRVRPASAAAWALPLDGLPCPEPEDADHLDGFDAARLFLLAARRVGAEVSPVADAAAIVEICRRLGGHPLALELAAAWTRVLGCAEIAAELAQGLGLLRSDDGSRPARHAGIAEVFERSWQLLSPAERDALARLSVFRGGFTAESARAAAGVAIALVGALVDKSLVAREGRRLHLHPLVQQLAADKLAAADPGRAVPNGHAAYFLDWLQSIDVPVRRGDREALQAVDAEFDNCRQAWRFAARSGPAAALMRAALPLVGYAHHRGRFDDALALVQGALDQPLAAHDPRLQGLLASQAAHLLSRLARYGEAEAAARLALARAREGRLRTTRFEAFAALGNCALSTGRLERAGRFFRQAQALARSTGRTHDAAAMTENVALVEKRLGRYEAALALTQEALAEHRRNGDRAKEAQCLSNLASLCMFMDEDAQARGHLQEALAIAERGGLVMTRAYVLANLTELAMRAGDVPAARQHAARGLEVAQTAGLRPLAGWLQVQLARTSLREGDLALARSQLAEGCDAALALRAPFVKAAALLALAELLEAQGQRGGARRVLALGVEATALGEADRDELRAEWVRRAGAGGPDGAPAGWQLDGLLARVVAERDLALGPLAAALAAA